MTERIRVGLVGTGDIGRMHARALSRRSDVELCVAAGVNREKAAEFAREFAGPLYGSYAELLGDASIKGVDICVPNDLHRAYVEQAAASGKAMICEKPIAMNLEDAEAMRQMASRSGVNLMIAHPVRFWPEYIRLRDELRSQSLGSCRAITMRRMLSLYMSVPGEQGWRRRARRMGGAMLDLQIHDLDFLYWTFGLPCRVYCAAAQSDDGAFSHVYATLTYGDGPIAMIESSYLLQGDPMVFTVQVVCERGSLDYTINIQEFSMHELTAAASRSGKENPATLVRYRPGRDPEPLVWQLPDVFAAVFARELNYFVDRIIDPTLPNLLPIEDSIAALRMALACRDSALSGQPLELTG